MGSITRQEAYCTLLTNDNYLPGAITVAHALRDGGTTRMLAVLVTLSTVSKKTVQALKQVFDEVIDVPTITNEDLTHLRLMGREDLASTFTKLTLWQQTQFSRIVYLDADTLPLRAPDELFSLDVSFAAAPELGFPDCFNSGVMVLEPSHETFNELRQLGLKGESFDGGDQGLLNVKFDKWERLSFMYNMELYPTYRLYMPAVKKWQDDIKVVHFIGKRKPWVVDPKEKPADDSAYSKFYQEVLGKWWGVYDGVRHEIC